MSESRIVVPDGMLKAVSSQMGYIPPPENIHRCLEAALRWLSDNPIVPTDEQVKDCMRVGYSGGIVTPTAMCEAFAEWQRRMFCAPEPVIPEDVKDLLEPPFHCGSIDHNGRIIEAYRRGQKAPK
jgi:hypothetical protein